MTAFTLSGKVLAMDPKWAADNLQVIRTLMERSALYRRALAPVMIFAGLVGTIASGVAIWRGIETARGFASFWIVTGFVAVLGVILLIRRQALRDVEPFWSLPTRRVAQAAMPPLFVGLVIALPFLFSADPLRYHLVLGLIPAWLALYGCALCAAGSFMPRGIKIFGGFFVFAGCTLILLEVLPRSEAIRDAVLQNCNLVMGIAFGLIHLLYGCYLYVTEQNRKNAA